jgi:hypothetical protein
MVIEYVRQLDMDIDMYVIERSVHVKVHFEVSRRIAVKMYVIWKAPSHPRF